jgi:hypothetical protein
MVGFLLCDGLGWNLLWPNTIMFRYLTLGTRTSQDSWRLGSSPLEHETTALPLRQPARSNSLDQRRSYTNARHAFVDSTVAMFTCLFIYGILSNAACSSGTVGWYLKITWIGYRSWGCHITSYVTACSLVNVNRRFGRKYRLHLNGRSVRFLALLYTVPYVLFTLQPWR